MDEKRDRSGATTSRRPLVGAFPALFVFLVLLMVYALTFPANHSESEDAFHYAWEVENSALTDLFYTSHLLYRPAMRLLWLVSGHLGFDGRAYSLMAKASMLAGALAATILFLLQRRIFAADADRGRVGGFALIFSLLMSFSYNYWRYSCEAEIYIPAILVSTLLLFVVINQRLSPRRTIFGGVLGALTVMTHIAGAALALIGVPAYYLARRRWRLAGLHLLLVALVLGAAFFLLGSTSGFQKGSPLHSQPSESGLQLENLPRAGVAVGQSIVSGNFLFASPVLRDEISARYPYRMLAEEELMGEQAPAHLFWSGTVTLVLLACCCLAALSALFKHRQKLVESVSAHKALLSLLLPWIGSYAAVMLLLEPGNPEIWIMLLPALWLLTALVFRPLAESGGGTVLLFALLALLFIHNWVGGMALLQDREGDYNWRKARWVLEQAGPDDRVLTAGNPVFVFYMRYHCQAELFDLNTLRESDIRGFLEGLVAGEGRVFAMADIFNPPEAMLQRFPDRRKRLALIASRLKPFLEQVHTDRFGGVFTIRSAQ